MVFLKKLFSIRNLRLLALGLVLLGSILLLLRSFYGETELVVMGRISSEAEKTVQLEIIASHPDTTGHVEVSLSHLLRKSLMKQAENGEFLAVLNRRGDKLYFERVYRLSPPEQEDLQGPKSSQSLTLAVGTKPELVEMIGLDCQGYQLAQPIWARKKMPQATTVYYQQGTFDAVKELLAGEGAFKPDLYILDAKSRIVGVRKIGASFLTLPCSLYWLALGLYGLAFIAGASACCAAKWADLSNWGRQTWDRLWKRDPKSSS